MWEEHTLLMEPTPPIAGNEFKKIGYMKRE
jgi:hypothetical protein